MNAINVDEIIEHQLNANMLNMPYEVYAQLFDSIAELGDENERLRSCLSDAAENRRLIMGEYKQLREENESLRKRFDRFEYKMGCLLCDLTGGLISKAETTDNDAIANVVHERLTQELEEENERLRQELAIRDESEQEKVIDYLSEKSVDWEDRYRALVSDNAKLRELVCDMWDVALHPQLFGDGSYLLRRMCDLGIEVG